MASELRIDQALIDGLSPVLTEEDRLAALHHTAALYDPLLHSTHSWLVSGVRFESAGNPEIIDAVNVGAEAYEVVGVHAMEVIPAAFVLGVMAQRAENPLYGINLVEAMGVYRAGVTLRFREFAAKLYEICRGKIPNEDIALHYGLGSAATMLIVHEETHRLWMAEKSATGQDVDFEELMDLA